jgi:hypothetical protein
MSHDIKPFENNSTLHTANDNAALDEINRTTAKALIRAAVTIVDGDGEYEAGDSFARIAVIDTHSTVSIQDAHGDAQIQIETEKGIQFHATAKSYDDFQIHTYLPGDWTRLIFIYVRQITPTRHWTFDDGSEYGSRRN